MSSPQTTGTMGFLSLEACLHMHLNSTRLSSANFTLTDEQLSLLLRCQDQLTSATGRPFGAHKYTLDLITYYVMGIAGVAVCCFGVIGNLLSALVLTRKKMYTSTYCYLAALAICDLFFVLCTLTLLLKDTRKPVKGATSWPYPGVYPYLFPYLHPAAFTLQVTSVWLTLAFTVDRYIMICHPYHAEPFCTVRRARIVVVAVLLTSVLFNIPRFFEYHTVAVFYPPSEGFQIGCDLTDFGNHRVFKELYHSWFYIVLNFGLPCITLAILNAFLVNAVRLSRRRRRQELNSTEKNRVDTTVMLIGVVIIFFICQLPALVSRTIWGFFREGAQAFTDVSLYTLNETASFLVVLNSSINIVPYYFFGRRFRKQFLALFCRCVVAGPAKQRRSNVFKSSGSRRDSTENAY